MTNRDRLKTPLTFTDQPEPKQKTIIPCTKCSKETQIPEGHYKSPLSSDCSTYSFLCSDCTHNEIIEKEKELESELEKAIISKLRINPEKKYSTTATAKILGISSPTVLREIKKGKIKFTRGKGKIRPRYSILGKELIKYAKTRHKQQPGAHISPRKRFSAQIRAKYP